MTRAPYRKSTGSWQDAGADDQASYACPANAALSMVPCAMFSATAVDERYGLQRRAGVPKARCGAVNCQVSETLTFDCEELNSSLSIYFFIFVGVHLSGK
jgi:hypothetical protein